ncbi:hypothetical protein Tco_1224757, partial [Tanacetum coccineum]
EQYTIEERAKFLHDTIAAQRKFLAEQRSAAIRNKPPTISQLRNQMITYLKHVANKKHADLKSKSFEEIQVLYERYKKQDQTFVAIGSEEDERAIKKMNEKDADKEEEKKDESVHEEVQEEKGAKKRKIGKRRKESDHQVNHGVMDIEILSHLDGSSYQFWQRRLKLSMKLTFGIHSKIGNLSVRNYTVPQGYPLTKEVLSNMLELKLETEEESSMALELIKFVKQQLEEFEDSNDDDTVTSTHEDEEKAFGVMAIPHHTTNGVNTPGSDENRLKLYDLMYKIVKVDDYKTFLTAS